MKIQSVLRPSTVRTVVTLAIATLIAACGGGSKEPAGAAAPPEAKPPGEPTKVLVIEGNDKMQYSTDYLQVRAGETVKITLKNVGTMPKMSMGHNFIIVQPTTDVLKLVEAATTAAVTDYVPPAFTSEIIAHTKLLGPGEEDSIIFVAPTRGGNYPFLCSFPGHYQIGMKGVMEVR